MTINDRDILRYEKQVTTIIANTFWDNDQTIISHLFNNMTVGGSFPLLQIDVNQFAMYFWTDFLSVNSKIKPICNSVVANHIKFETRKYIANIWVKNISKSIARFDDALLFVNKSNSSYISTKAIMVGTKSWQPTISLYTNNKPNQIGRAHV